MANELLTSFKTASRAYDHIVYNQNTQRFERAGKRHAIATFFGSAEARAKNRLTLEKIREALTAEMEDGGRFSGYAKTVDDSLFSGVSCDRRIRSATVREIVRTFRSEVKMAPHFLQDTVENIASSMLDLDPLSPVSINAHIGGMEKAVKNYEGYKTILRMVFAQMVGRELAGLSVSDAVKEINADPRRTLISSNAAIRFVNFLVSINKAGGQAKEDFVAIFEMGRKANSSRYDAIVGCELSNIVNGWMYCTDSSFNLANELGNLRARLENPPPEFGL